MQKWFVAVLATIALSAGVLSTVYAALSTLNYLTRAEACELLLRASRENVPILEDNEYDFPDVFGTPEETKYIYYAAEVGMINSNPERGLIFPYRSVSRAEFLKMLTVAFELEYNLPHEFTDIESDAWYKKYIGAAGYYDMFVDATQQLTLKPNLRVSEGTARVALEKLYKKEPSRKPKNFSFKKSKASSEKAKPASSPSAVKLAIRNLFKKKGGTRPDKARHEIIDLVNEERNKEGLDALSHNLRLRRSAQKHAKDMHERRYFSHVTPEGVDYIDRIKAAGYLDLDQSECGCTDVFNMRALIETNRTETTPNSTIAETEICRCRPKFAVGENIAVGQLTPKEVMKDWMNSPGHRKNILHSEFAEIGIGLFGDYWVQNFGRMDVD
ncbi:MAG: CAP domain-containing protein [Candidatus Peribacteraceae bacterium]|jgi:uncharacterized protein YkwD|nr:CAP domain-containing protein [Candidatus Peribacteraceae bacterium]|tara:strand:- start:5547 stop:6701 length:1155 start_codon:yes stop_codon:yes gene_type:complete